MVFLLTRWFNSIIHEKYFYGVSEDTDILKKTKYNTRRSEEASNMIRKIIHIDEEKCNGCGLCASACHEGAIEMVNGKAKLVRENFCDGFGDCLPGCPMGAITFEEREAPEYDEKAVQEAKEKIKMDEMKHMHHEGGCPGSRIAQFERVEEGTPAFVGKPVSRLGQWPCQIKLVPTQAPFFDGAKLLIAADCTAYAYANMHEDFMRGKVTIIGCPKLDAVDYTEKLTEIIRDNDIKSVTIVRMEVPCCGGLQRAAENALKASGKFIPWQVVTITRDGKVME
jgi:ferredoxin